MSRIYPYAGFWRRAVALLIDSLIIGIVSSVLYILCLGIPVFKLALQQPQSQDPKAFLALFGSMLLFQVAAFVFFWLYFALQESGKAQATLGKKAMGIKVVGADGGRISFWRATGRTFGKMVSNMTLYFGYYMAGFTAKRQALHDLMATTYVVREDFQPGQEKPVLNFSVGGLIASILATLLPIILAVAALIIGIILLPEEDYPQSMENLDRRIMDARASTKMIRLSMEKGDEKTPLPLTEDDISYAQTDDGYRAEFTDKEG
ncbi:MAG: RDD family protein, partial [Elusimicrobiales bacterium]|nr:RDD family protein [Elusimicrobiales bacterium]